MAELSEYEEQRQRNIAENNARLAHIGLLDDALACRTQRRTLTAEELAASAAERARARPVASIYESSAALDALERDARKERPRKKQRRAPEP